MCRITAFFADFAQANLFINITSNPQVALQMLRHAINILNELSTAKENSFKNAIWPMELIKIPSSSLENTLTLRKWTLKLIGKVLQHFSSDCLMHLAEIVAAYFAEIQ
jgi:hypothetical protein